MVSQYIKVGRGGRVNILRWREEEEEEGGRERRREGGRGGEKANRESGRLLVQREGERGIIGECVRGERSENEVEGSQENQEEGGRH